MGFGTIAVGMRIGHMVDPATFISWSRMLVSGLRDGDQVLLPAVGLPHSNAANVLCERYAKTPCDSLLMIDDDMTWKPQDVDALRDSGTNAGVVSGLACMRRHPYQPVVLRKLKDKVGLLHGPHSGIVDVDYVGLAFTLIKREVLESLGMTNVFKHDNHLGEDGSFCKRAKNAGFKIAVNADVKIRHRATITLEYDSEKNKTKLMPENFGIKKRS